MHYASPELCTRLLVRGKPWGREEGLLSSHSVSRPAVIGLSSLLPCRETLDSLPGAQPLLESLENLEGPLRGEVEARGLARCGYGFRKTRHLRGLWAGPEGSMPTSALHSSQPVPSTGRPAPLEFYCSLQTCLSPGLGKPKAVLGWGLPGVWTSLAGGTRERPGPQADGGGCWKQSQLVFFPPWV